jgi:hypothetical protein
MDTLASPSDSSVTHCEPEARLGVLTAREIIADHHEPWWFNGGLMGFNGI